MAALVLVCVAGITAVAEFTHVETPDVRTRSLADARKLAVPPFQMVTVVSGPQDGVVQTQDPLPKTTLQTGNGVLRVWMQARPKSWLETILGAIQVQTPAAGGKQTQVPALYGLSKIAAAEALQKAHLRAAFPEPVGDEAWGVVQQDPAANTSAADNALVTVNMGPAVPALTEKTEDTASMALSAVGLTLGHVVQSPPPLAEPRTVLRQAPEPGRFLLPGSPVDIWIPTRPIVIPPDDGYVPPRHIADPPPPPHTTTILVPKPSSGTPAWLKWATLVLLAAAGVGLWRLFHPGVVLWQEQLDTPRANRVQVTKQPKIQMEWRAEAGPGTIVIRREPTEKPAEKGAQR